MKAEMTDAVEWLEEIYDELFTPRYAYICDACDKHRDWCEHEGTKYRPLVKYWNWESFENYRAYGRLQPGSDCDREFFEVLPDMNPCGEPASEELEFCGCYPNPGFYGSLPPMSKEAERRYLRTGFTRVGSDYFLPSSQNHRWFQERLSFVRGRMISDTEPNPFEEEELAEL